MGISEWVIIPVIQFLPSSGLPKLYRSFVSNRIYHYDGSLSIACSVFVNQSAAAFYEMKHQFRLVKCTTWRIQSRS